MKLVLLKSFVAAVLVIAGAATFGAASPAFAAPLHAVGAGAATVRSDVDSFTC